MASSLYHFYAVNTAIITLSSGFGSSKTAMAQYLPGVISAGGIALETGMLVKCAERLPQGRTVAV
jgi:hypothetical protein